jgi:hypothetical protein
VAIDENATDGSLPPEAEVASRPHAPAPIERTFVLGYFASILTATLVLALSDHWRSGFHQSAISAWDIRGMTLGLMVLALPPFVGMRALLGAAVMASPAGAGFVGVLTAMLTGLLLVLIAGGIKGIFLSIILLGVVVPVGAVAGIAYWLVEFSPVPALFAAGLTDRRPTPWTGGLLSRRLSYGLGAIAAITVTALAAVWFTRPTIDLSHAEGMPRIERLATLTFDRSAFVMAWSKDGATLAPVPRSPAMNRMESENFADRARVHPPGEWLELTRPFPARSIGAASHAIVFEGDIRPNPPRLFSVIDVTTGDVVHVEPDPDRGLGPPELPAAVSADGKILAFTRARTGPGSVISIFLTNDWTHRTLPAGIPPARDRLWAMALSGDGHVLAIRSERAIDIIALNDARNDARPPRVVTGSASAIALDFDGSLIAVQDGENDYGNGMRSRRIRVIQISDGREQGETTAHGPILDMLRWDPRGRFLVFASTDSSYWRTNWQIHLWRPLLGETREIILRGMPMPEAIAFSPDGKRLAIKSEKEVALFGLD